MELNEIVSISKKNKSTAGRGNVDREESGIGIGDNNGK